jgi:hypothetical protein
MIKRLVLFAGFLSLIVLALGQNKISIKQSAQQVNIDILNQVYLINRAGLQKYNSQGVLLAQYQNALLGTICLLDVSNPLRLMAFYKNSGTLLFLNQQLATIGDPIDCFEIFGAEIALACSSSDGGFWVFNPESQKIHHCNASGEITIDSQTLNDWLIGINVISIKEYNQHIYLVCENKIMVFDAFGTYLNSFHFQSIKQAFFIHKAIVIYNGKQLIQFDPALKSIKPIPTNINADVLSIAYQPEFWALLYNNRVEIEERKP